MYSIDTSALMDGWVRYYPPDVIPSLWDRMHDLVEAGSLLAIEEVFYELEKKADDLYEWVKSRPAMIVEIDEDHQARVKRLLTQWPRLVDSKKNRSGADPFVIALAEQRGLAVVTGERPTGSLAKPMIPDVCEQVGVRSISLLEMIREQGWRF